MYLRGRNSGISYAQFVVSNVIARLCYIYEKRFKMVKQIYYDGNHQRMHGS
jgi:pantothenate kinase